MWSIFSVSRNHLIFEVCMQIKKHLLLLVLVGLGFSLCGMPFNNRRRNQPPQPAVVAQAPVVVKLQDQAAGIVANGVYEAASEASRREVQSRVPIWNIVFCENMDQRFLAQQMVASRVLALQYFADDLLEEYRGQLAGVFKTRVDNFRLMCTKHAAEKTILIHDIRVRTNSTYNDNGTFAVQHGGCRGL